MKMSKRTATHRRGKWHDLGPLNCSGRSLNEDNTVRLISISAGEYKFELSLQEALLIGSYAEAATKEVVKPYWQQKKGK